MHEIVAQLAAALTAAGIGLDARFAAGAAHFEGWGIRDVLDDTASPEVLKALAEHDELPDD